MNYRHAFHAGNFGDCFKHSLLVWLLRALHRKPAPITVLDTHAGRGRYDLSSGEAARTGEWHGGIGRLLDAPPAPLADYIRLARQLGLYPGSPAIAHALLRPGDRLVCCELQPEDHAALRGLFARDASVAVHRRDAWEALGALLPPSTSRGLVLIDPPYEAPGEFERLADGIRTASARFRTGVIAAWYPIKHRAPVRAFKAAIRDSAVRDVIAIELWLREPVNPARLNGCGLLVVNPPFGLVTEAPAILDALRQRLGGGEAGEGGAVERIVDE
jgi:23S rRNA (adenine2030-N6)-methyltransferase